LFRSCLSPAIVHCQLPESKHRSHKSYRANRYFQVLGSVCHLKSHWLLIGVLPARLVLQVRTGGLKPMISHQ